MSFCVCQTPGSDLVLPGLPAETAAGAEQPFPQTEGQCAFEVVRVYVNLVYFQSTSLDTYIPEW